MKLGGREAYVTIVLLNRPASSLEIRGDHVMQQRIVLILPIQAMRGGQVVHSRMHTGQESERTRRGGGKIRVSGKDHAIEQHTTGVADATLRFDITRVAGSAVNGNVRVEDMGEWLNRKVRQAAEIFCVHP
jgi:hypothetical protein